MKFHALISCLFGLLLLTHYSGLPDAGAQSSSLAQQEIMSRLKSSVMSADAAALADETMYSVEIAMFGEGRHYSRGQATLLLKNFFREFPPLDFEIENFTRTPSAGFIEGRYESSNSGDPIQMFFRLRLASGKWKIRELLIEESDG